MLTNVVRTIDLDVPWVLAPERYDPRRPETSESATRLTDVAIVAKEIVSPPGHPGIRYLVLDTGDARAGFLSTERQAGPGQEVLGSAKKRARAGDVIISRLRPYLRQVAYVDAGFVSDDIEVVVSTEFFVLRSLDEKSIAFLVPFLLSAPSQTVLAAAQEGGHHPRFSESTLTRLPIPEEVLTRRDELSSSVEDAVAHMRIGEASLDGAIRSLVRGTPR